MAGKIDDFLPLFTKGFDNLPTGSLDNFVDSLRGASDIDVGVITSSFKNDNFLKTLANAESIPPANKTALFKKLADIDDPELKTAIKNAGDTDVSFKTFLKENLSPELV